MISCSCRNYKFKSTRMQGRKGIFFVKNSSGGQESDEGTGKWGSLFGKRYESPAAGEGKAGAFIDHTSVKW